MMDEQADTPQVGSLWQMRRHKGTDHQIVQITNTFSKGDASTITFVLFPYLILEFSQNSKIFTQEGENGYYRMS